MHRTFFFNKINKNTHIKITAVYYIKNLSFVQVNILKSITFFDAL